MKQTAVEWLMDKYRTQNGVITTADYYKAKEMEKQQIMQSLNDGKAMAIGNLENKTLEQYYNETFKSE